MTCVRGYALLLALLSAALTSAQAAGLYKWTDENGTVHYSQIPPTERPAEVLTPEPSNPPAPAAADTAANGNSPLPEGMIQGNDAPDQLTRKNCEAAQTNLATYQSFNKIIEPDGTELVLSNEMREAKIREAQEQIRLYCQ